MTGKDYLGAGGSSHPTFQNIGNYIQVLKQLPEAHHILQCTVMPCIGLEVLGTDIRCGSHLRMYKLAYGHMGMHAHWPAIINI